MYNQMDNTQVMWDTPGGPNVIRSRMEEFARGVQTKKSALYFIWLLIAALVSYLICYQYSRSYVEALGPMQLVYYVIVVVHFIRRVKTGGRANVLAPDVIFIVFYTIFHLGYVSLYTLGVVPYFTQVFFYETSIPKSMLIINLGLISFIFGYEIIGRARHTSEVDVSTFVPKQSWEIFGILLMILAILMHFAGLYLVGFGEIAKQGYAAIAGAYQYSGIFTSALLTGSVKIMVFAAIIYTAASALRYGKLFRSKLALALAAFFILLSLMEGDRGTAVKCIIPIFLIRHYIIKRFRIRYLIIMLIGTLIVFSGLAVVRKTVLAPSRMLQEYMYQRTTDKLRWYTPFLEAGQSYMTLNIVCGDVPVNEEYWMGDSWMGAVMHVVPFLQGQAIRKGWIKPAPSQWLRDTYFGYETPGRGFTITGEGYLNFGMAGVFLELLFVGVVMKWLIVGFAQKPTAIRMFIFLGFLGPVIMAIRDNINLVIQPFFMVLFVSLILYLFFKNETAVGYNPYESVSLLDMESSSGSSVTV